MTITAKSSTVDAAAQASIGVAARELHLPTVRAEAGRLAEIADRERQTHLRYLAEVLAAEVDDRTERRRTRRINDAKFPRLKRLAEFNVDAVPTIGPATLGQLATGHYMDAGEPVVLLGDSGTGKSHLLIGLGLAACEQGRRVRYVTTPQLVNEPSRPPMSESCPALSAATRASIYFALTNSDTSRSTPAALNCCSRSSPNAKNEPRSRSRPTCPSANGVRCSPTRGSSPPSSTASPSTPTSSRPAPIPTDCATARPPPDESRRFELRPPGTIQIMEIDRSREIWNRAAMAHGGPAPRSGDTALSSALAFHNMVMSGGIDHAFEVLTNDQIAAAADGYRYLNLLPIVDLIGRAPAAIGNDDDEDAIEELDNEYSEVVPMDQTLVERFEASLQRTPEDFAPIS